MKGAIIAKEDKLNNEPENLIVINTDKEKKLSLSEKMYKAEDEIIKQEENITKGCEDQPEKYRTTKEPSVKIPM